MEIKKPWERRLKDLAVLLGNCNSNYFDPDLFRLNTNQFLQTSRTVTFIIQKNKAAVPKFEQWYKANVLNRWEDDEVMLWAKNSRNIIEKEGDLELYSSINATLIFSYLKEEDVVIECGKAELLGFGVKKLARFARKHLPTGISDAAVIKIERKWITSSLPEWELLHALSCVYSRIYECCELLALYLGAPIDNSIPGVGLVDPYRENTRKVQYKKLRGIGTRHLSTRKMNVDRSNAPPDNINAIFDDVKKKQFSPRSLREAMDFYSRMAEATFEAFTNHVHMLFMFNKSWQLLSMVTTEFEDQADKYIFWRAMSERAATQDIGTVIWIAELWLRDLKGNAGVPIRNMPIKGEFLEVIGVDYSNCRENIIWKILRENGERKPRLLKLSKEESEAFSSVPFFFVPIMRAMGMTDEQIFNTKKKQLTRGKTGTGKTGTDHVNHRLTVATCNRKRLNLQSSPLSDRDYLQLKDVQTGIICN